MKEEPKPVELDENRRSRVVYLESRGLFTIGDEAFHNRRCVSSYHCIRIIAVPIQSSLRCSASLNFSIGFFQFLVGFFQFQVAFFRFQHFYKGTNRFSGTSYPTSNMFFGDICNIKLQMMMWESSEYEFLRKMANPMKLKFEKYWNECCLVLAIAVVFDPRYKMSLVEYYYNKIHGSLAVTYVEHVRNALLELFNEYDEVDFKKKKSNVAATSKTELELYLEESLFPITNSAKHPTLAKIARDILAVPATSVASEAAFSTGGRIIDESRSSLSTDTVEALVTTQDWLPSRKQKKYVA
ncbi:hypothetical protein LXL04_037751 [Taraxacum kok-saghyz]